MTTLVSTLDLVRAVLSRRVPGLDTWEARVAAVLGTRADADVGKREGVRRAVAATSPDAIAMSAPAGFDRAAFLRLFAAAARELGSAALDLSDDEAATFARRDLEWLVAGRATDELARVMLLVAATRRMATDELETLVEDCYRHGELRERVAVMRALAVLPASERLLALAIDACRSSVQPVFEAIAAENPFPAARFPEASFNQMALKAVFTGMPVGRIIGLGARRTPELARMADDYASERRAAGRPVPGDLALLAGG